MILQIVYVPGTSADRKSRARVMTHGPLSLSVPIDSYLRAAAYKTSLILTLRLPCGTPGGTGFVPLWERSFTLTLMGRCMNLLLFEGLLLERLQATVK
jgi:hypothetical protein